MISKILCQCIFCSSSVFLSLGIFSSNSLFFLVFVQNSTTNYQYFSLLHSNFQLTLVRFSRFCNLGKERKVCSEHFFVFRVNCLNGTRLYYRQIVINKEHFLSYQLTHICKVECVHDIFSMSQYQYYLSIRISVKLSYFHVTCIYCIYFFIQKNFKYALLLLFTCDLGGHGSHCRKLWLLCLGGNMCV